MPKKNPSDGAAVGGILFILSLERHEAFWLFAFVRIAFLAFRYLLWVTLEKLVSFR